MRLQVALCVLFVTTVGLSGCASGGASCANVQYKMSISPTSATVNHAATPPGDQQQFRAGESAIAQPGCPVSALVAPVLPVWTSSDPLNVKITNSQDYSTNGIATCSAATSAPVTLTATYGAGANVTTATATLTCN